MNKKKRKEAYAVIKGGEDYPGINGTVMFYQQDNGVLVTAQVRGLPEQNECCTCGVFGFHIHEGIACTGEEFSDTKAHFNPKDCMHPYHAGDLPPLFSNNGYAYMSVLTNRFYLDEVIGRTVVVHSHPDDFTTQPSGDSGEKIACGKIVMR